MKFRLKRNLNYETLWDLEVKGWFRWKRISTVSGGTYNAAKLKADEIIVDYMAKEKEWEV